MSQLTDSERYFDQITIALLASEWAADQTSPCTPFSPFDTGRRGRSEPGVRSSSASRHRRGTNSRQNTKLLNASMMMMSLEEF